MSAAVLRDCKFKVVCETERLSPSPPLCLSLTHSLTRCCSQPQSNAQTCELNTAPVIFLFSPPEGLTAFQQHWRLFHLEIDLASKLTALLWII